MKYMKNSISDNCSNPEAMITVGVIVFTKNTKVNNQIVLLSKEIRLILFRNVLEKKKYCINYSYISLIKSDFSLDDRVYPETYFPPKALGWIKNVVLIYLWYLSNLYGEFRLPHLQSMILY